MDQHIAYVERLVEHGGPRPSEYPSFNLWIKQIAQDHRSGKLCDEDLEALRDAFGEALSQRTLQGFCLEKPHGYAGDYEIIDQLYTNSVTNARAYKNWDHFLQARSAATAVRNRKSYFLALIEQLIETFPDKTTLPILNVASGPGRDVFEFFCNDDLDHRIHFECVDNDPDAIAYAQELCASYLDRICFREINALRYRADTRFQLIWSAGLFDYLGDKGFTFLLERMIDALHDDGELVIGNFSPRNPTRDYMEVLLDWHLYHRTADELIELATSCGIAEENVRVGSEPEGVNLFLHVKRGESFLPVHSLQG
jgi:SAM-dependent methyltransferase